MLKSLQLAGFKSFAEKTRLDFPAGVTVVVGPNGSGKSNVVDGVKWVLGSQSPRSLRGKEMTDVIFNGSESRGPMGSAEVTLAFDNSPAAEGGRRLFDLDEPEIHLTRRVGRSGEGEYLVNGRTCRLKDFRELLAGTGVGADSYSIIEQGRVDAALRASPLERRLLLEEAAGISRFRLKKREAAKRLDRVEQNLLRLSDIVDEVEGRLRRVRSQAGKARRYREASLRLKEARTELAASEWRHCDTERRRLDAEHADLVARLEVDQASLVEQEARLNQLQQTSTSDEAAEQALQTARQRVARHERLIALSQIESEKLTQQIAAAEQNLLAARTELAAIEPDAETQRALSAAEATHAEYEANINAAAAATEEAEQRVVVASLKYENRREAVERRDRLVQRAEALRAGVRQRRATFAAQADALANDRQKAAQQAAAALGALQAATDQRDAAADGLMRIDQATAAAQRDLSQSRRRLTDLQARASEHRETLVGLKHRLESILEEERRLERLNDDVRRLIDQSQTAGRRPPGVYGLVADLIHVEDDFVSMVEATLGPRAEHVVVDSRAALLEALVGSGAGEAALSTRAGFQSLDATVSLTAIDQIDLSNEPGVLGRAADFVEVEPRFAPLVRRLFGRTWFVESLAVATRLSEAVGRGLSLVTPAGEVVREDGGVLAGPNDAALRMLTRRDDATRLDGQITDRGIQLQAIEAEVTDTEQRIAAAERSVAETQSAAAAERDKLAAAAQQAATLDERRRHADADSTRLGEQLLTSQQAIARLEAREASLAHRAEAIGATSHQTDGEADLGALVREAENRLSAERARLGEMTAAAKRHAELLLSLRKEAAASGAAGRDDLVAAIDTATAELEQRHQGHAVAEAALLNHQSEWWAAMLDLEAADRELSQSRAARRTGEQIRLDLATAIASARAEVETLARRTSEIELRRQRVAMEATTVAQRVRDDYGVDVTGLPPAEGEPTDPQALRDEIETLRREVQGVGAVNLESLEELDDLETRFADLSGQYQDLSEAKKSLARLTARINTDSRQLFKATFETVREHFRELFSRLFGGGEADLLLVDPPEGSENPTDPLEGGVEIVACPPGKELRSLSLLSGGEKTMTCVALLLALFRSRPSPFCLLDEVDAALDEANVGRFLDVLKDFLGQTQFIVISHSKRTMSGADTIYGITMQESGVSKQMSVRFEEVSEDGHIRLRREEPRARRAA